MAMLPTREKLEELTSAELAELSLMITAVQKERKLSRRKELIDEACKALNALRKEFPEVSLYLGFECGECGVTEEIDALEAYGSFSPSDFKIY
jgi:NADH:ubiquinone oxidoreductase subunit C